MQEVLESAVSACFAETIRFSLRPRTSDVAIHCSKLKAHDAPKSLLHRRVPMITPTCITGDAIVPANVDVFVL